MLNRKGVVCDITAKIVKLQTFREVEILPSIKTHVTVKTVNIIDVYFTVKQYHFQNRFVAEIKRYNF